MLKKSKKGIRIESAQNSEAEIRNHFSGSDKKQWLLDHEFQLNDRLLSELNHKEKKVFSRLPRVKECLLGVLIFSVIGAGVWLWQEGENFSQIQKGWNLRFQNVVSVNQLLNANIEERRIIDETKSREIKRMNQAMKSLTIKLRELQLENKELHDKVALHEAKAELAVELTGFQQNQEARIFGQPIRFKAQEQIATHIQAQL